MANEFENIEEDFPEQKTATVPGVTDENSSDMIAASAAGTTYDWTTAPDTVKAPPRKDLNDKTVTIKKADIILPPFSKPWEKTRDKTKDFKYCGFKLYYDLEGQQEFYSGVRVFKVVDDKKNEKYSPPSIPRDRQNQASQLLGKYADFKKKDINEVSLREFMGFLNSQPKAVIKTETVKNPTNGETIQKNMISKFV